MSPACPSLRQRLALAALPALLSAGFGAPAAAQNFIINIESAGAIVQRSFATQQDALNLLSDSGIASILPGYTSGQAVTATVSLLGVPATITLPAGGTAAVVSIPAAGVTRTVTGATRGQVQTNLRQLFEGRGDTPQEAATNSAFVTALRQTLVRETNSDPVAGHPLSLMGQMFGADYRAATNPIGALPTGPMDRPAGLRFSLGGGIASTSTAGAENRFLSLPIAASYTFGANGIELFIDAPVSSAELRGVQYYQGSGGVGLRIPVLRDTGLQWSLVPQLRVGAAGSDQLATGGYIVAGTLTSDLRFNIGAGYSMQIGNMIGYNETQPIEFNGVTADYALQNQVYRNGVAIGRELVNLGGVPLHGALSFVDSRVSGSATFVPSWQEYGVQLFAASALPITLSAAYLDGRRDFTGFRFNLTVAF